MSSLRSNESIDRAAAGPRRTPGEVARLVGVHVETLRYYERLGLLPPPARTAAGRRFYSDETINLLRSIRAARGLGLHLREIQSLRPAGPGDQPAEERVVAMLERILEKTRSELEALTRRRSEVENLLAVVRGTPRHGDLKTRMRLAWRRLEGLG